MLFGNKAGLDRNLLFDEDSSLRFVLFLVVEEVVWFTEPFDVDFKCLELSIVLDLSISLEESHILFLEELVYGRLRDLRLILLSIDLEASLHIYIIIMGISHFVFG